MIYDENKNIRCDVDKDYLEVNRRFTKILTIF